MFCRYILSTTHRGTFLIISYELIWLFVPTNKCVSYKKKIYDFLIIYLNMYEEAILYCQSKSQSIRHGYSREKSAGLESYETEILSSGFLEV